MVGVMLKSGHIMAGMNEDAVVILWEDREGGGSGWLDPFHA